MKSLRIITLTILGTALLCTAAFAELSYGSAGSTVIPRIVSYYTGSATSQEFTALFLTNISNSDVECTLKVYDHAGNRVSNICEVRIGNSSSNSLGATVAANVDTFAIPAKSTRRVVVFKTGIHLIGHAIIEWTSQDSSLTAPLIGVSQYFRNSGTHNSGTEYLINGGQPF